MTGGAAFLAAAVRDAATQRPALVNSSGIITAVSTGSLGSSVTVVGVLPEPLIVRFWSSVFAADLVALKSSDLVGQRVAVHFNSGQACIAYRIISGGVGA